MYLMCNYLVELLVITQTFGSSEMKCNGVYLYSSILLDY